MRLSNWGYRADFYVYPVLIAASTSATLWHGSWRSAGQAMAAGVIGIFVWTALEYALHRWVLHRVQPFKRLHAMHHAHPGALIGTPAWLSAPLFLAMWAALGRGASPALAGGFITGMMVGYLAYAALHDAVHHRRARPGTWLYHAKLRHACHHRDASHSEYGVSCGLWDAVLHTSSHPSPPPGRHKPPDADARGRRSWALPKDTPRR